MNRSTEMRHPIVFWVVLGATLTGWLPMLLMAACDCVEAWILGVAM